MISLQRTFIETEIFQKRWKEIGLNENDLLYLQLVLLDNPKKGNMIQRTGGIRKLRFIIDNNKGKSGGARVCYLDFAEYEVTYLITAFSKDEKENLSDNERNILKKLANELKKEAKKSYGKG